MVKKTPVASTRLIMAIGFATTLIGCSTTKTENRPDEIASAQPVVEDRFTDSDSDDSYTIIVPKDQYAQEVRSDRPAGYVVVRGDTLWGISAKFLKSPWLWPKIWEYNPGIKNPDLIYPGDHIALEFIEGQPRMVVSRNGERLGQGALGAASGKPSPFPKGVSSVERLSPQIRVESLDTAIPTIAGDAIQQFLVYPRVVSAREIERAPYVIGNYDGRLTSAAGHQIYVRGRLPAGHSSFGVFRNNKALKDPVTGETLGYEVTHVADARLVQNGDPATFLITANMMETLSGDRLMATSDREIVHNYVPRMPKMAGEGRIISLVDAITQSGRNQIVVLNMGKRAGVEIGDVMAIERRGGTILDAHHRSGRQELDLPSTRTGVLMVFQTFDKVAYALVMESQRPIHINDIITDI